MEIFGTVAKVDHLGLFTDQSKIDSHNLMEFLNLSRSDLAAMFKLSPDSIRFDSRMSLELQEKLLELANLCNLVAQYFEGNHVLTKTWFMVNNPRLKDQRPIDLVKKGQTIDVATVVIQSLNSKDFSFSP